jgi:hypothetical protein
MLNFNSGEYLLLPFLKQRWAKFYMLQFQTWNLSWQNIREEVCEAFFTGFPTKRCSDVLLLGPVGCSRKCPGVFYFLCVGSWWSQNRSREDVQGRLWRMIQATPALCIGGVQFCLCWEGDCGLPCVVMSRGLSWVSCQVCWWLIS